MKAQPGRAPRLLLAMAGLGRKCDIEDAGGRQRRVRCFEVGALLSASISVDGGVAVVLTVAPAAAELLGCDLLAIPQEGLGVGVVLSNSVSSRCKVLAATAVARAIATSGQQEHSLCRLA